MDNNMFRKILICGILVLFLVASIATNISGYNGKTSIQITNENPTNFFLNNDYLNAYWKFDECSDDIAYDSSGNGYDGTIYGASWIPQDSGCYLYFDGMDDYIDFSDYAENYLGFNKTDDLIFSFYFKSSLTDKGIIYSTCRGDSYGYNPGFHIAIKSDGRLQVQVWRFNCGIIMNTTGTYNDDSWHLVEIFYNGITANPIVDIYIDNQLDISLKQWVCNFYSDQFHYAQMGRRSDDFTDYYNGGIDEFKITKYPGGNEQYPPTIDGPTHGESDVEYNYTFITDDPEGDNISIYISWDDDTYDEWIGPYQSGEEVIVNHTWDEDGSYNITARSKDRWDQSRWSESYEVKIGNLPPDAPIIGGPTYGDVGENLTYTFVAEDPEGHTLQYFIDWGDTNTEWTTYYASGEEVNVTHAWDIGNNYVITAFAKDDHDDAGPLSEPYPIRIGNQPPNAPQIDGPLTGFPGVKYEFTVVCTDPEEDNVYYEIEWGDGTTDETDYHTSGEIVTVSHVWSARGNYTIKARACDTFGAYSNWSNYTFTVPRNKDINLNLLEWLFERFPNAFPVLRRLILRI